MAGSEAGPAACSFTVCHKAPGRHDKWHGLQLISVLSNENAPPPFTARDTLCWLNEQQHKGTVYYSESSVFKFKQSNFVYMQFIATLSSKPRLWKLTIHLSAVLVVLSMLEIWHWAINQNERWGYLHQLPLSLCINYKSILPKEECL